MKPIVDVIKRHIYLVAKYHIFNIANMRRLVVDFQPIIQLFFKKSRCISRPVKRAKCLMKFSVCRFKQKLSIKIMRQAKMAVP